MSKLKAPQESTFVFIDPSASTRAVAREVAHEIGFHQVQVEDSIDSFLRSEKWQEAGWVITGLFENTDVTGFHLLRHFLKTRKSERALVSFLIDESELETVSFAYALGLLSHHMKPVTKASMLTDFGEIIKTVQSGVPEPRVAARFLRKHLRKYEKYSDCVVLEDGLIRTYDDSKLYLNKADAHFQNGSLEEGRLALAHLLKTDPNMAEKAQKMMSKYTGTEKVDEKDFTIENAIVIDSDGQSAGIVRQVLEELEAKEIKIFDDGQVALDWMKGKKTDIENSGGTSLVIMEWKIPGVTGPILLQNIRLMGIHETPVIILSSLVKENDQVLLSEVGVDRIVEKPIDTKKLISAIIETIKTAGAPRTSSDTARRTRALLKAGKTDEAKRVAKTLLDDPTCPNAEKLVINAEFLFIDHKYEEAREALMEAIKEQGQNVHNLNLLGKCLMALRDFDNATNCFQKAQKMSPDNIERLCQMAESESESGNSEAAQGYIASAEKLSKDADVVGETVAKIALNEGDIEEAASLISGMKSVHSIVSFINNQAVAYSKMEKFDEGVSCYRKALKAIPEEHKEVKPVIQYNLVLTLIKMGDTDSAAANLKSVVEFGKSKVYAKARNLQKRLAAALEAGQEFKLRTANVEAVQIDLSDFDATLRADFAPGDICLYGIYHNLQDPPASMKKFFASS